ncbi:MAG: 50S ribosomal protein L10 [Candidatus Omnitrophica bacterium]|nr:50S ribosomal protein L10 [Candidatus Omnitrophota bacterium]MBU4303941.1 50S ribosomal protein L10 [Candidatus Omnitrophota bacterium]MBU4418805.1 50S ribosomal protein L10 [Candidatus Omnitrophota bacterium]MBU4468118.1 50S ribosomal protein L10 [Candidatus Omnitrophota bacterium]MCG2707893.1 50S ribosomal protein L10 [Candidatus Omnitrophota bacterium]
MKKIGQLVKETSESRIKDSFKASLGLIIVKYSGVSSPDMSALRKTLKGSDADLFVVKNSIARRAMKELGLENLIPSIQSPCGMIFFKDEPVDISRILCAFRKEHEKLILEGGLLQDKLLTLKDIELMSKLPSKDALRGKLVVVLNSPILKLVVVLNQSLKKFVYCLDQIKQKKSNN